MPLAALAQIHVLVTVLFLLLFGTKAALLFLNKHQTLGKVLAYTKELDLLFGALVLATGFFLAFSAPGGWPTWLWVKTVLVLAVIPLALLGLRRHNKVLTAASLLLFLYVYAVSETKSLKLRPDKVAVTPEPLPTALTESEKQQPAVSPILDQMEGTQQQNTKAIYSQVCQTCHGPDGQQTTGGAVNLQQSSLSVKDRRDVIANGRGLMPGYRSQLTELEMEALAKYTTLLKSKD